MVLSLVLLKEKKKFHLLSFIKELVLELKEILLKRKEKIFYLDYLCSYPLLNSSL